MSQKTLNLTLIQAFAVESADDERSSSIKGYYRNKNAACIAAKGSGWYNSDGIVKDVEVWTDRMGNIFVVKDAGKGKFVDDEEDFNKKMFENVKSKLTPEEFMFLKQNFSFK